MMGVLRVEFVRATITALVNARRATSIRKRKTLTLYIIYNYDAWRALDAQRASSVACWCLHHQRAVITEHPPHPGVVVYTAGGHSMNNNHVDMGQTVSQRCACNA